jgi:hypothetical protein
MRWRREVITRAVQILLERKRRSLRFHVNLRIDVCVH